MKHDGARANDRGGFKKQRVEVLNFGYQDMELLNPILVGRGIICFKS
jgi:hypothetical protein